MCGGFSCSKNALIALNILYVVSGKLKFLIDNEQSRLARERNLNGKFDIIFCFLDGWIFAD